MLNPKFVMIWPPHRVHHVSSKYVTSLSHLNLFHSKRRKKTGQEKTERSDGGEKLEEGFNTGQGSDRNKNKNEAKGEKKKRNKRRERG